MFASRVARALWQGRVVSGDRQIVARSIPRRAFVGTVIRSTAAFAMVAVFGRTFGLEKRAEGRALATCADGTFQGIANGGGSTKAEAIESARNVAKAACASYCTPLEGCSGSKPTCNGNTHLGKLTCGQGGIDPPFYWGCTGSFTCDCVCSRDA
jgi:hypothetical protein